MITMGMVVLVLWVLDRYNPMMNFVFNRYSKTVLFTFFLAAWLGGAVTFWREKEKKWWLMVLVDVVAAALVLLGIYSLMTRPVALKGQMEAYGAGIEQGTGKISGSSQVLTGQKLPEQLPEPVISGAQTTFLQEYQDETVKVRLDQVVKDHGSYKNVFYIAQIAVTDITRLHTELAGQTYGQNLYDTPEQIAADGKAILAINGDYYGGNDGGCVIRNGVLYRNEPAEGDVCVIYQDGRFECYPGQDFDGKKAMENGAWQAWTFGPMLLDGNGGVIRDYHTSEYIKDHTHPRTAIGYISPGNYVFVVEDGRQEGYSGGITLDEMAQVLMELGCKGGYNMDGGASAVMLWNGQKVNRPADGGRDLSDLITIKRN